MERRPEESVWGWLSTIRIACGEEMFACPLHPGYLKCRAVGTLCRHYSCTSSLTAGADLVSVLESHLPPFAILLLGTRWPLQNLKVLQDMEEPGEKERRGQKLIMRDKNETKRCW